MQLKTLININKFLQSKALCEFSLPSIGISTVLVIMTLDFKRCTHNIFPQLSNATNKRLVKQGVSVAECLSDNLQVYSVLSRGTSNYDSLDDLRIYLNFLRVHEKIFELIERC